MSSLLLDPRSNPNPLRQRDEVTETLFVPKDVSPNETSTQRVGYAKGTPEVPDPKDRGRVGTVCLWWEGELNY